MHSTAAKHKHDSAALRYTLGPIGLLAAMGMLAVSATMNYRFGFSLGKTPLDGEIYGWASVAADAFKAIGPFFFFAACRTRNVPVAVATFLVWLVTTAFGLTSAGGHASLNRLDTTGARAVAATSYQDTRTEIIEARKARGYIPEHRPEATVRAELEKHKTNRFWNLTNECTETAGKTTREYCSTYQSLNSELGSAMQAVKLDARIEALVERSDKASGNTAVNSEADPQATIFVRLLRWDIGSVQVGFAVLIVLVLEIGGGLGPYTALSYMFAGRRRPEPIAAPAEASATLDPQLPPSGPPPLQITSSAGTPQDTPVPALSVTRGPKISEEPERFVANFVSWCVDNNRAGIKYWRDSIDDVGAEFCAATNREPIAQNDFRRELGRLAPKIVEKWRADHPTTGKKTTYYEIKTKPKVKATPPINRAAAQDVESAAPPVTEAKAPAPSAPGGGFASILPFVSGAAASPVKGPAVLHRYQIHDLALERLLVREVRQDKLAWQQKMLTPHRKQLNRFSRARAA